MAGVFLYAKTPPVYSSGACRLLLFRPDSRRAATNPAVLADLLLDLGAVLALEDDVDEVVVNVVDDEVHFLLVGNAKVAGDLFTSTGDARQPDRSERYLLNLKAGKGEQSFNHKNLLFRRNAV